MRYWLLLSFIFIGLFLQAQISHHGYPISWEQTRSFYTDTLILPPTIMVKTTVQQTNNSGSFQFAVVKEVSINNQDNGIWDTLSDGSKIWQTSIKSEGAYSLNFTFSEFIIPDGAAVFVYSADRSMVLGAFTSANMKSSHVLPVSPVIGDQIIIEYDEPADADFQGLLSINRVGHDYSGIFIKDGQYGESDTCNLDINCYEGLIWQSEKRSVCRILINNTTLCTGVLVNNTRQDKTPYVLTANHCISAQTMAENSVFLFNYESPSCGGIDGSVAQSVAGADLVATKNNDNGYLDFTLLQLSENVPDTYSPYFAGWDISGEIPQKSTCIHHPYGDVKKIALDYDAPEIDSYDDDSYDENTFWEIQKWDVATTEPGSSGSPLFSQNHCVIGTLSGGAATCSNPVLDYFQMLSVSYDTYTDDSCQLKHWLDPLNTNIETLDGYDPDDDIIHHYSLSDDWKVYSTDSGYISGNNILGHKAKAEYFSYDEFSDRNFITGGLAYFYKGTGNDDQDITFFIIQDDNGIPGSELATASVKLSEIKSSSDNAVPFYFSSPIEINSAVYVGVYLPQNEGDTVVLYNSADQPDQNYAWEQLADGTWQAYSDDNSWSGNWINYIGLCTANINSICQQSSTANQVVVYPNPADRYCIIENEKLEFNQIRVFNNLGRMLYSSSCKLAQFELLTQSWPNGLYIITFTKNNGNIVTAKLLVNH